MSSIFQIIKFIYKHPLAKKHLIKAFVRFLFWQISQRLNPKPRIHNLTSNSKIWVAKGMTGVTGSIYTGLHEFEDMCFLLHFLRKDDLFADIGANVGIYSVLASADCRAKTLTFEPAKSTFEWIEKNKIINKVEHLVQSYNIGLGEKEESLKFSIGLDTINHVIISEQDRLDTDIVFIKTFDSIAIKEGVPILVKIDVEGFETPVIRGMQNTLDNPNLKAIIIELNGSGSHYGYEEKEIHNNLIAKRFIPYSYNPFLRILKKEDSYNNLNTIYIRDFDFVAERIEKADKINIFGESF